ncbi:MAG: hypothetical protein J0M29_09280 [Chitinophagales bacterium]|nr:hypothetical protein [Chitinophagales bacterium]
MAQLNWVFLDDFGGRHKVGLYHGDRTGHVMIHCNLKVVQIDFSVKDTKMYSFFIEDELCEVILEKRKDGAFAYEFRVNKKVDTPRNRVRRVQEGQNRKYMTMVAIGIVVVLLLAFFGLKWYGHTQELKKIALSGVVGNYSKSNMKRLGAEGKRTVARLHLSQLNSGKEQTISYALLAVDSLMDQGEFKVPIGTPLVLPTGFPFTEGDEFEAIYLPSDPSIHRVNFFQPTRVTTTRYLEMATKVEREKHPAVSPERSVCRVLTAAEHSGWPVLAHIIFQEKTPEENKRYNQTTYEHLWTDASLIQAVQEKCKHSR